MSKINLLTLHYADNNGSALQAYATCKILRNLGHEVTVINLQNKATVIGKYKHPRNWKNIRRYINFILFRIKYLSPMTIRMYKINTNMLPACDYTVVGSDQTWNADFPVVKRGTYFLNFVKDESQKIALASSFGKAEWEEPPLFTEKVRTWLSDFKAISVREKTGVDICKRFFQRSATHVLDPTLALGDFSELIDMQPRVQNELRCFLFKRGYSLDVVDYVSKQEHLSVCQVNDRGCNSYRQFPYWKSSPIEWMKMIRDAKVWVSDSFHGVAFGIIFKKQFIALCNDKKKLERVESLLKLLGLEDKLVYSLDDLQSRYAEVMAPIDYDRVFALLKKEQDIFISFIQENIQ